jgi:hypothetical protein
MYLKLSSTIAALALFNLTNALDSALALESVMPSQPTLTPSENLTDKTQISQKPTSNIAPPETLSTPEYSPQPERIKLESLTTDLKYDSDNTRTNRITEPTAQFKLPNGDRIQVKSGWNTFEQTGIQTIQNFPIQTNWVKQLGENTLKVGGGLDVFNRLPIQPRLQAEIEVPIGTERSSKGQLNRGAIFKLGSEYGPYKFNAKTLENGINVLHIKPQVYWQIDPKTSLYSHYKLGVYNDGNVEHQTFSRIERKIGNAYIAGNLFTWNYKTDNELSKGYFSPQQFLTYSGEIGWDQKITDNLSCRVSTALGQQSLNGQSSQTNQYNARCNAKLSPNMSLDLGYGLSNERRQNTNNSYQNQSLTAQLQMTF